MSSRLPPPQRAVELVGLTATTARVLLGPPSRIRHEPPAEVWQYRADQCVLDVYVYATPSPPAVRYAEVRGRGAAAKASSEDGANDTEQDCMAALLYKP